MAPTAEPKIVTTEEEIEAFYIVRGILAGTVPVEDVVHRDTESYFGILYKDNNRKPICRINLDKKNKQLLIPDENKKIELPAGGGDARAVPGHGGGGQEKR